MTRQQLAAKRQAQAKRTKRNHYKLKQNLVSVAIVILLLLLFGIVGHYDHQSALQGASVGR